MSKLTLSVDPEVVARAKSYARKRGLSVSEMVEGYLSAIARPAAAGSDWPILRALRGTLKKGKIEDYRRHLVDKYR